MSAACHNINLTFVGYNLNLDLGNSRCCMIVLLFVLFVLTTLISYMSVRILGRGPDMTLVHPPPTS